jgi:hypothetical protein
MAQQFRAFIYGEIEGQPPFQNSAGASSFTRDKPWPAGQLVSFPSQGVRMFPLPNGILVGNNYVYSVLEVPNPELTHYTTKYAAGESVATLVTAANA